MDDNDLLNKGSAAKRHDGRHGPHVSEEHSDDTNSHSSGHAHEGATDSQHHHHHHEDTAERDNEMKTKSTSALTGFAFAMVILLGTTVFGGASTFASGESRAVENAGVFENTFGARFESGFYRLTFDDAGLTIANVASREFADSVTSIELADGQSFTISFVRNDRAAREFENRRIADRQFANRDVADFNFGDLSLGDRNLADRNFADRNFASRNIDNRRFARGAIDRAFTADYSPERVSFGGNFRRADFSVGVFDINNRRADVGANRRNVYRKIPAFRFRDEANAFGGDRLFRNGFAIESF